MSLKNSVSLILLTSIDSATIAVINYTAINPTGLGAPCFLIRIINNSNEDITVSFDGINDNEFVPKTSYIAINTQTNAAPNNYVSKFSQGTKIYVRGTAGIGLIYLAGYYSPNQ